MVRSKVAKVDVAIIGAGPGGTLMAYLLAEQHGKLPPQRFVLMLQKCSDPELIIVNFQKFKRRDTST